jgi:hypothetical protein
MPKKWSNSVIEEIRCLRTRGYSVPEISKELVVPKTTVLRYVQGISISPEYINQWAGKRGGSRKKMLKLQHEALMSGKKLIAKPNNKEKLLFLSALYWAEGSKKDFGLSNTDPDLIKVFVDGLRTVLGVSDDNLRISVRIYEDLDRESCLKFWSDIVGIPTEKFVNVNVLAGKKKGKLQYGMCRVRVAKGAFLLKKLNGINQAIVASLSS